MEDFEILLSQRMMRWMGTWSTLGQGDRLDGTLPWVLCPQEGTGRLEASAQSTERRASAKGRGASSRLVRREVGHGSSSRLHPDSMTQKSGHRLATAGL